MKKIAVIAVCDYLSQPNGGEVYLLNNLFSANKESDIEYFLVGITFEPSLKVGEWTKIEVGQKQYDFLPIAKVIKDKEKTHIPFRLRCVIGMYRYWSKIQDKGITECYIHSAELGIPLWSKKDISIVYHVHGDPSQTMKISRFAFFRTPFWTNLYLMFIRKTINRSRIVIWAARRSKELYLSVQPEMKKVVEEKGCVVHSSFDTKLKIEQISFPVSKDRKHLITVGRLSRVKRIDFIITVVAEIVKDGYDVDLLICGDGEERTDLEKITKQLGIEDRVAFLGVADRVTLATALDMSEVFLFASENEAMSLVVLESLYMGTPVVSTDVGDIADAVIERSTGAIIVGYNLEKYKAAVERLLTEGKERYSANCKQMAMKYTPERMAETVAEVLR